MIQPALPPAPWVPDIDDPTTADASWTGKVYVGNDGDAVCLYDGPAAEPRALAMVKAMCEVPALRDRAEKAERELDSLRAAFGRPLSIQWPDAKHGDRPRATVAIGLLCCGEPMNGDNLSLRGAAGATDTRLGYECRKCFVRVMVVDSWCAPPDAATLAEIDATE